MIIKTLTRRLNRTTFVYKNEQQFKFKSTTNTNLTKSAEKIIIQEQKSNSNYIKNKNRNFFDIMSESNKQVAFINAKMNRGQVN